MINTQIDLGRFLNSFKISIMWNTFFKECRHPYCRIIFTKSVSYLFQTIKYGSLASFVTLEEGSFCFLWLCPTGNNTDAREYFLYVFYLFPIPILMCLNDPNISQIGNTNGNTNDFFTQTFTRFERQISGSSYSYNVNTVNTSFPVCRTFWWLLLFDSCVSNLSHNQTSFDLTWVWIYIWSSQEPILCVLA